MPRRLFARLLLALSILGVHATSAFGQAGGAYELRSSTIDGGGVTSLSAGTYRVGATIGQPDAGAATGGSYVLDGGFWSGLGEITVATPTPTNTGTVLPTHTVTALPSATGTASAVPTTPGTLPTASVTVTAGMSTPSTSPSSAATPSITPTATATGGTSPTSSSTPLSLACVGDCDQGGTVNVAELIRGVNIALRGTLVAGCPALDANGDDEVTIDELIEAVNRALNGCSSAGPERGR